MTVLIRSGWPQQLMEILKEEDLLLHCESYQQRGCELTLYYGDDLSFRDLRSWGQDALGCGLVQKFDIER